MSRVVTLIHFEISFRDWFIIDMINMINMNSLNFFSDEKCFCELDERLAELLFDDGPEKQQQQSGLINFPPLAFQQRFPQAPN